MKFSDAPKICQRAVDTWGLFSQLVMVMEEAGELIQAVSKILRVPNAIAIRSLAEECADMEIMLLQVRTMIPESHLVDEYKLEKLNRLTRMLDESEGIRK